MLKLKNTNFLKKFINLFFPELSIKYFLPSDIRSCLSSTETIRNVDKTSTVLSFAKVFVHFISSLILPQADEFFCIMQTKIMTE